MAELPKRRWLTLAAAINLIREHGDCSARDAEVALNEALRDGALMARGSLPLNARASIERAWSGDPATRQEAVASDVWVNEVDWLRSRVWRYRCVEIERKEVLRWLKVHTEKRSRGPSRRASTREVEKIVRSYVNECDEQGKNSGQKGALEAVKPQLPNATREQVNSALIKVRGVARVGRPSKNPR